jgi:glycosyltransferase involved in cell wall biosynthesis
VRVVFANKSYYPAIGGVETVVRQLAEGVAGRGSATVVTCHEAAFQRLARASLNGVEVVRVSTLGTRFSTPIAPSYPLHLRRALSSGDLVHLQIPFPVGEAALAVLERDLVDKPLVITFHADPALTRWGALLSVYRPLFTRTLARADRVVVTAPQNLEHSPSLLPFRQKVRVIPLAPDEHLAGAPPPRGRVAALRRELALEGAPVVLFLGRLAYYKGVDVLLESMRDVPGAILVVAGDGELAGALREKARALSLWDRVRFVGRVPDEDVPAYFHLADVFAFPSVTPSEAFGIVQLEALRAGVPVVNTALPTGVPFVSPHGETGLTVAPGDPRALAAALNAILEDPTLRSRFSSNAKARALEFSLSRMREAYFELYEECLGRR